VSRPTATAWEQWRSQDPLPLLLVLLTLTTGLVDAVSYLGLGHVFTANMTGNVVLLGFALAGAKGLSVVSSLLALAAFLLGAVLGGRLGRAIGGGPRHRWLLVIALSETVLLVAAAFAAVGLGLQASDAARAPVIALTAVAMGLRNATVRRLAVPDLTATVLTLTLTGLAADSSLAGGTNPRPVRRISAVAAMLAGAVLGALLVLHHGLVPALVLAATITLLITVLYALHPAARRSPDQAVA
jgi:uncharacterized membrane protein YoaK (UPF0700 family)